jgi:hypothetical protein
MKHALFATVSLCILAFGAQAQTTATPQNEGAAAAAPSRMGNTLIRNMSLRDLGFRDGISFSRLSGEATVYFPVLEEAPLRDGFLSLDFEHGATNGVERFLQVRIGDRIAASVGLPEEGGRLSVPVSIRPDDLRGGFVPVTLTYSGGFSEFVCIDERASGDFIQISPDSALSLTLAADEIDTPWEFNGLRPSQVYVQMPQSDQMAGLAAAVRAATLFGAEQGGVRFGTEPVDTSGYVWETGAIALDVTTSGTASEMEVVQQGGKPVLHLRGTDPQIGLWQLSSDWAEVADAATSVTGAISDGAFDAGALALTDLGADLQARLVASSMQFQIPFQSSDLPVGKTVSEVDLILAAGLDPSGAGATATVYLNDTLLGSRPLAKGEPERVKLSVPSGVVGRDNLLRVLIQRQVSGGACREMPQSYPAQVLPGSKLILSDATGGADQFYQLRQEFESGAQIFVDPDMGLSHSDVLPWLGNVAGTMVPDQAPIIPRNALTDIEAGTPFIILSDTNPGDGDPLITVDGGRIEIRDRAGNVMFDGDALERLGIVQIVTRNGVHGLWVRPGSGPAPASSALTPFVLDRGDVALIAEEGVIVATSTRGSSLIDVVYPDRTSLKQILDQYRPWIVGGLWLALTLIVLAAFQRIYRRRQSSSSTDT